MEKCATRCVDKKWDGKFVREGMDLMRCGVAGAENPREAEAEDAATLLSHGAQVPHEVTIYAGGPMTILRWSEPRSQVAEWRRNWW